MSYFGNALKELLERKNMKSVRLSELSGVGQPMISRYIRGDQTWVDQKDLARMAAAISDKPAEQAELVRARLLDELSGPGSELVRIEISGRLGEAPPSYGLKLPDNLERCFALLREWVIKDADLRDIIEGLGGLLGSKRVETADRDLGEIEVIREVNSPETAEPVDSERTSRKPAPAPPSGPGAAPQPGTASQKGLIKYTAPGRHPGKRKPSDRKR